MREKERERQREGGAERKRREKMPWFLTALVLR